MLYGWSQFNIMVKPCHSFSKSLPRQAHRVSCLNIQRVGTSLLSHGHIVTVSVWVGVGSRWVLLGISGIVFVARD